jgi:hypothetical protein
MTIQSTLLADRTETTLEPSNLEPSQSETVQQIQNPILRGFNPDPSILRVGDDYYKSITRGIW